MLRIAILKLHKQNSCTNNNIYIVGREKYNLYFYLFCYFMTGNCLTGYFKTVSCFAIL